MNGPTRVYPLRQIVLHDQPVQLPDCMYRLPNIHQTEPQTLPDTKRAPVDIAQQVIQFLKDNGEPSMVDVVEKQERVLKQLDELKRQMLEIRESLHGHVGTTSSSSSTATTQINIDDVGDVVVTASPSHPPYSLLLLRRLWAQTVDLQVRVHVHSSVISLPDAAKELPNRLADVEVPPGLPVLTVTLIWKEADEILFALFVSNQRILGECNFLRYMARATSAVDYDESTIDADSLLDLSNGIAAAKTKTERGKLLHAVKRRLGKSPFVLGDKVNVADIALYSAVRQTAGDGEVVGNLVGWMRNCETVVVQ